MSVVHATRSALEVSIPTRPRIVVHRGLAAARPSWRALEAQAPHHAFLSWDWVEAWQRHVGAAVGVEPLVVEVLGPDGRPWMLHPLGRSRRGPLAILHGLGGVMADYQGPILAPDAPEDVLGDGFPALWEQVLAALPRADVVHLARQPATLGGRSNPLLRLPHRLVPALSHQARLPDEWLPWMRERMSSKTRGKVRRKRRRMEDIGPVRVQIARTPEERRALLPVALARKAEGYAALGVPDLFAHPGRRALLDELAAQGDSPLHVSALWVGDVAEATHIGLVHGGCLYSLYPGYRRDGPVAHLSPGDELCRALLRWSIEHGLHTFDFTLGDEPYKDRWCVGEEQQFEVLYPRTAVGRLHASAQSARVEAIRAIKASEVWYPRALAVRSKVGALQRAWAARTGR